MELAGLHAITIERNATFRFKVSKQDGNGQKLSSNSAHLQVRRTRDDPTVLLDPSTEDGRIELSDDGTTVTPTRSADETLALRWLSGW